MPPSLPIRWAQSSRPPLEHPPPGSRSAPEYPAASPSFFLQPPRPRSPDAQPAFRAPGRRPREYQIRESTCRPNSLRATILTSQLPSSSKKKSPVRAATLADVGRAAGVSAMAASAVLNRAQTSSRISAETRDRIFKAASRLRYRPNAAARGLANRRMNTIGVAAVIERGELNQYFLEVFNGVLEAAANNDQNATVFTLHNWEGDAARLNGF